jgi:anti-sigma B factor antagonist
VTNDAVLRWGGEQPPVAHLSGEIDLANAAELFTAIRAGVDGAAVVDLSDVSFINSSALNQLVRLHQDVELRVIAGPGTPPRRLLDLTGLAQVFRIYDQLDTALANQ